MNKDDIKAIDGFLLAVNDDITFIVKEHLHKLILDEFKDLVSDFEKGLGIVSSSIKNAINFLYEKSEDIWIQLEEHALTGEGLRLKLAIYKRARKLMAEYLKRPLDIARGFIRRFLGIINTILNSLANIIPGLGAVTEFKNSLHSVI